MKAPVSRRRGKRPTLSLVTMDLLGRGLDGNLYLWSAAQQVEPLDRFPMNGKRIVSGHYVLHWNGKAITAHVGNAAEVGELTVQIMCQNGYDMMLSLKGVEPMLLGRYVPDPVKEAKISRLLQQLIDRQTAQETAPHRKRGPA